MTRSAPSSTFNPLPLWINNTNDLSDPSAFHAFHSCNTIPAGSMSFMFCLGVCEAGQSLVTGMKVQAVPNTPGRREHTCWRALCLTANDGASLFWETDLKYCCIISWTDLLRSHYSERDCRNRLHGWSPGLLTFAVTYPVITRYRKKTTLWHSLHWLSTGNVWARAWRKLVHHQRILTGWKSRTPLHPGCMTLASSNPVNSPIYQSTHIIYLFQCSRVLLNITAASPYFISAKLPFCFLCCIKGWSRRIDFLKMANILNQP